MSFLLGWRALGKRLSKEFDGCFSQLLFGELLNEVLFNTLEKSSSNCFIEDDL